MRESEQSLQENFEQVFERYYSKVYRFALALCQNALFAEELAQQTFFKALQSIGGFRGECRIEVWLCQIAKHEFYANRRRRQMSVPPESIQDMDAGSDFELALERKDEARRVHLALHRLEEPYKEVFSLRIFGELPFLEIAQLFGKTESWARVTFYRAKLKIVESVKEDVL